MKQADILKVIGAELGSEELATVNSLLREKAEEGIKYRMLGRNLRHLGYTAAIKAVTADGVKIYDVNRVTLIKFVDIEKFEKAPPKVKIEKTAPAAGKVPPSKKKSAPVRPSKGDEWADDEDDEYDDDDLENFDEVDTELAAAAAAAAKKKKPKGPLSRGGGDQGSKFIPSKSKKPGDRR